MIHPPAARPNDSDKKPTAKIYSAASDCEKYGGRSGNVFIPTPKPRRPISPKSMYTSNVENIFISI